MELDPISYRPLRRPVVVVGGTRYHIPTLRQYVVHSGDARDPLTREPLGPEVLEILGVTATDLEARRAAELARRERQELVDFVNQEITAQFTTLIRLLHVIPPPLRQIQDTLDAMIATMFDLHNLDATRFASAVDDGIELMIERPIPIQSLAAYMIIRSWLSEIQYLLAG